MKRFIIIVIVLINTCRLYADYLFLIDGSFIQGKVISENESLISIKDKENKLHYISRSKVLRVLYADVTIRRVMVQTRGGDKINAYLVDESSSMYTFRKKLDSPEEFTLRRENIYSISERNPAGLKAEPGSTRLRLSWYPSSDRMKFYRIYIKKSREEEYRIAEIVSGELTDFELKGLTSNTKYFLRISGVDNSGEETDPSNEIETDTNNILPDMPWRNSGRKTKNGKAIVRWSQCADSDGRVVKYRIYTSDDNGKRLVAETEGSSAEVGTNDGRDFIFISSVDELGGESSLAKVRVIDFASFQVSAAAGFLYPAGKLDELQKTGYGVNISFQLRDVFYNGIVLGIESGLYYAGGIDALEADNRLIHRVNMSPVQVLAGYGFNTLPAFSLVPYISAGGMWYRSSYILREPVLQIDTEKKLNTWGPAAEGGLMFEFDVMDTVKVALRCGYVVMIIPGYGSDFSAVRSEVSIVYMF